MNGLSQNKASAIIQLRLIALWIKIVLLPSTNEKPFHNYFSLSQAHNESQTRPADHGRRLIDIT
jgi:hypothetical protein